MSIAYGKEMKTLYRTHIWGKDEAILVLLEWVPGYISNSCSKCEFSYHIISVVLLYSIRCPLNFLFSLRLVRNWPRVIRSLSQSLLWSCDKGLLRNGLVAISPILHAWCHCRGLTLVNLLHLDYSLRKLPFK